MVKNNRHKIRLEAINYARAGDVIVVWKLDRLGRSLKHLLSLTSDLEKRQIGLRSLHENIDTTTPTGKLVFHIFASLTEFEKDIIRERTKAGLEAARSRGRTGGRPRKLTPKQQDMLLKLYADKTTTIDEITKILGISKKTLYNYLNTNPPSPTQP